MTRFSVDLDELASVAAELEKFQRTIERRMADLDKLVADLHLTWQGRAAAAHLSAHQQWSSGAQEMHQGLGDMHRAATVAHDNYHSAATSNADMFKRTR